MADPAPVPATDPLLTPEAVGTGIFMFFDTAMPFLDRIGAWMTLHWGIIFPQNWVAGKLVPLVTWFAMYVLIRKARLMMATGGAHLRARPVHHMTIPKVGKLGAEGEEE